MSTKALVDGDVIVYLAGFGAERVQYSLYPDEHEQELLFSSSSRREVDAYVADNNLETYVVTRTRDIDPLEFALHKAKLILEKIASATSCKDMQVLLSGKGNFRNKIATYRKYKGNRDASKRPHWYKEIKQYLVDTWGATYTEGQEADDALGIIQCSEDNTIICSTDKDLLQISGMHYNITHDLITEVMPDAAHYMFLKQILTGDPTDNIVGCPGIGAKKAEKILKQDDSWKGIVAAYADQLAKRSPEDMTVKNTNESTLVEYSHWNYPEATMLSTLEAFVLEMARLVYIRHEEQEMWCPDER